MQSDFPIKPVAGKHGFSLSRFSLGYLLAAVWGLLSIVISTGQPDYTVLLFLAWCGMGIFSIPFNWVYLAIHPMAAVITAIIGGLAIGTLVQYLWITYAWSRPILVVVFIANFCGFLTWFVGAAMLY